jgi:secondary thiamine-phosphate synthase enzyme
MIRQDVFLLPSFNRGYHIITEIIVENLGQLQGNGIISLFINHTSAALSINENADPTVRDDFESFINKLVPENDPVYRHVFEGSDDMPAHIKSSLLGPEISIPFRDGKLLLGTWQGIYLCEFRNHGGRRRITSTIIS